MRHKYEMHPPEEVQKRVERVAAWIQSLEFGKVTQIISSDTTRAVETAEAVAKAISFSHSRLKKNPYLETASWIKAFKGLVNVLTKNGFVDADVVWVVTHLDVVQDIEKLVPGIKTSECYRAS